MGKHLPGIDGLRAFAVLSVVAYHAGLPIQAGFVGVDVFFVISGYVITRMLLAEPQIDLAAFYARRVRRILPALVVVVASVLALSATMLPADVQVDTNRSAVAAMGMVANIWFQVTTGGYFDVSTDQMPLLHLWSLGVEEQFYLLWPLLLITCRRPWALALLALASFGLAEYWISTGRSDVAFYQMPARFWELAVGGLIAFAPMSRLGKFTAWAGLPVLCLSVVTLPRDFPGMGAAMPVLGTALVLYACHVGTRTPLEWKPLRYVGLVSYSFYLWHWPLLAIAKAYSFDPPTLTQNLALCGLAFVLASLSYHFVELPFRRTQAPKGRAIALGVTVCALLAGCAAIAPTAPKYEAETQVVMHVPVRGCFYDVDETPEISAECGDGDVLLWGDSHAYMWRPVADQFGKVTTATRAACAPNVGVNDHWKGCGEFGKIALERAKDARVVVLAAHWAVDDNTAGMKDVLDALGDKRVIVMGPLPEMPYLPLKCFSHDRIGMCVRTRADFERQAEPIRAKLREAIAGHPNATLVDPTDFFCTDTSCPLMKDGYPLYRDLDHITAKAAAEFTRSARPMPLQASQ